MLVTHPVSLEGGPGEGPCNFLKIYVSKNAFQAILKPFLSPDEVGGI